MKQNIIGKTFDSRNVEQEVSKRVLNFIDENHEKPFFAYYALHSGHAPFNSAEKFRNQTEAGIFGEVIMEADEIVGQIMDKLEEHEIADDTLVILMTDNGPTITGEQIKEQFGHNQWLVDLPESENLPARTVQLQGMKNGMGEASHRTPFMWRYPRKFEPRTIYEPKVQVSSIDIYATLAELIDYDLNCNEAPDSRSLVSYLETGEASDEVKNKPIMTHAYTPGNVVAIRKNNMKYVPGVKELFNVWFDPEEKNNLYNDENQASYISHIDKYLNDWLEHVESREEATRNGAEKDNCYPQFERFNRL
jgi:arylsulfatase A-like enzyme